MLGCTAPTDAPATYDKRLTRRPCLYGAQDDIAVPAWQRAARIKLDWDDDMLDGRGDWSFHHRGGLIHVAVAIRRG